ncbi:PIN domain-containing protein [Streptomyces zhihengii]
MLISPLPGASRDNVLKALNAQRTALSNLQSSHPGTAYKWLVAYLRWAAEAARHLRNQLRDSDIDRLVLTRRYDALLAGASSGLAGSHQQGFLNDLLNLEFSHRLEDFDEAIKSLRGRMEHFDERGLLVVADTSVYIKHAAKLEEWDLRDMCGARDESLHLMLPMAVVDELDNLKQSKDKQTRWRAGYSLAVLERLLAKGVRAPVLMEADASALASGGVPRGRVTIEILYDPPGHVRLPISDDEIIDRSLAVQPVAGRPVRLMTYDTGQSMRGREAGLQVSKLQDSAGTGPEPSSA